LVVEFLFGFGMTKHFEVDGILFDLDGTMLDTIPDLLEAANRMLRELGQPERSLAEITAFVGHGIRNLVHMLVSGGRQVEPALEEAALPVFKRHYSDTNGQRTQPYGGVLPTLEALRAAGYRLGCVTNKSQAFTGPLLEQMGLAPLMEAVVCGDTLPTRKPSPEPLLHACALLGLEPARTLMVGDSANDAISARLAGIPVVLVTYGYSDGTSLESLGADGSISVFREILPLLSVPE